MAAKDAREECFFEEMESLERHARSFSQVAFRGESSRGPAVEELYQIVLDVAPDRMFAKDLQGRYILFNRASSEYWAIPREQALGRTDFEIHPANIAEIFSLSDGIVFETGEPHVVEEHVVRGDGSPRVLAVVKIPLRDAAGGLWGLIGISRDITELNRYRETLSRRDDILKGVNRAAELFLRHGFEKAGLMNVLATLGDAAQVSRVCIFENSCGQDGAMVSNQLAEWCASGVEPRSAEGSPQGYPWHEGGLGRWAVVMQQGECIHGHVSGFPTSEQEVLRARSILSLVAAPILVDGEWWGYIGFDECSRKRDWDAGELDAVRAAANMIGAAVQHERARWELFQFRDYLQDLVHERTRDLERTNSELCREIEVRKSTEEKLSMRAAELAALNRLGRKVNATLAHETVAESAVEEIIKALMPDAAVFFLRRGRYLLPLAVSPVDTFAHGENVSVRPIGDCLCGQAATSGEHVFSLDIFGDPLQTCRCFKSVGFRSVASIPLVSDEEVLGVLAMASKTPRNFGEEVDFIQAFSNQVSIGLRNALLYEQLQWHVRELRKGFHELQRAQEVREELEGQLRQVQKMEAIGTLAGGIAHEFNNLLQSVQGYAELLLLGKDPSDADHPRLKAICRAAMRGGELTQQLLTFSRKSESKLRPIALNQEILETVRILERTLPKMIQIQLELADDLPTVQADPQQIEQVLINLALNARDAMPLGGILTIESGKLVMDLDESPVQAKLLPGEYVRLRVRDTGHGMDSTLVGRIFDPFFTTKEVGKGTGLGLAIVYGIIQNHCGTITCESEPGKGTCFDIYFPVASARESSTPSEVEGELVGGRETILIVDDEDFLRTLGEQVLGLYGYVVLTAADADAAIAIYEKECHRIDLIILDLIMPGKSGYQCMEKLFEINPEVRIIVASGYLEMEGLGSEQLSRARAVIRKPYEMRDLLQLIRKALDEGDMDDLEDISQEP
jgi:PAS domain S-box-containing protein